MKYIIVLIVFSKVTAHFILEIELLHFRKEIIQEKEFSSRVSRGRLIRLPKFRIEFPCQTVCAWL